MMNVEGMELAVVADNRRSVERRQFGWRTVMYGYLRSRRHGHRRSADSDVIFMDRHHPWLFFLSVGTMLLSATDAVLTLKLLELGFFEANPVMASIMGHSTTLFTATKMAMTGFGVLVLVFLAKAQFFDRIRTGIFLTFFFTLYACLICYEAVSLFNIL